MAKRQLTYAEAGVDRRAADRFVERLTGLSKKTLTKKVKSKVGGYASLFEISRDRWIAATTDGVGTKLKLAFESGVHSSVGIDLVAMSVNDLICVGAQPLFFLDYFATGKLKARVADQVIAGVIEGCHQAGCALVGGETAEMPDLYRAGEYDLGGFAVGCVDRKRVLPRLAIRPGDVLIGLQSSGTHSNGYSLIRKLLPKSGAKRARLILELLTPTRIYVQSMMTLINQNKILGAAHITGSGFLNLPRISDRVDYKIQLPHSDQRPPIYRWLIEASGLPLKELAQTFNMGVGMVLAVRPADAPFVLDSLKKSGERASILGSTTKKKSRAQESTVTVQDAELGRVVLS